MQARLQALAATVPSATRALLAVLGSTYLLQLAFPGARSFLGLVVAKALTQPWTFLTSTFVIDSIVEVGTSPRLAAPSGVPGAGFAGGGPWVLRSSAVRLPAWGRCASSRPHGCTPVL